MQEVGWYSRLHFVDLRIGSNFGRIKVLGQDFG